MLLCLIIVPSQTLILFLHKGRYAYILTQAFHIGVCTIFNIRIRKSGTLHTASQTLYMSNHLSHLDICALGTLIQQTSFVAKKDVASWPLWGYLAKLQQTAFVSRSRGDAKKETNSLDTMLANGKNLVIFPEGTSTDGAGALPFKSSLFAIALRQEQAPLTIQPISINLIKTNGKPPQTHDQRCLYAWPRELDMELPTHLWRFAQSSGAVLEITFHEILRSNDFSDRKILAKACHEAVCKGLDILDTVKTGAPHG